MMRIAELLVSDSMGRGYIPPTFIVCSDTGWRRRVLIEAAAKIPSRMVLIDPGWCHVNGGGSSVFLIDGLENLPAAPADCQKYIAENIVDLSYTASFSGAIGTRHDIPMLVYHLALHANSEHLVETVRKLAWGLRPPLRGLAVQLAEGDRDAAREYLRALEGFKKRKEIALHPATASRIRVLYC